MVLNILIPQVRLPDKNLDTLSRHSMNKLNQSIKKNISFVGAVSLLVGLPVIPFIAEAEPPVMTEPSPYLDIDPPAPQTAPGVLPIPQLSPDSSVSAPLIQKPAANVTQPPLPLQRQDPVARVVIPGGQVDVRLINRTGTVVRYEAMQVTHYSQLSPGSRTTLQDLRTPATIMLDRPDGANLRVTMRSLPGLLEVYLNPTANFNDDKGVVRIQESGAVYLN